MTRWLALPLLAALAAVTPAATAVHFPVTTANPQAQAAFDRGLFFYAAFDRDGAQRLFAAAVALDPKFAMGWWGQALANGPDLNTPADATSYATAQHDTTLAESSTAGLSPTERALIDAQALRYRGSFANAAANDAAYRAAILRAAETTNDSTVMLLAAEALMEVQLDDPRARRLVDSVLARDPANPMANHLCIHSVDNAADRTPAQACAQRLDAATFSPEGEHLAHMPAHYWIETGDYAKAAASSERAYALLEQLQRSGLDLAHVDQYAKHDVGVGYSAAMMLGDYRLAQRWSARMTTAFGYRFDGLTALRFDRYADAFAIAPDEMAAPAVRGYAAVMLGKMDEARRIGDVMAKQLASNPNEGYLPQLFLARLAEAEGRDADAVRWLERARDNERAAFSAEDIPLFPAGEALGGFYYRHGTFDRALEAFDAELTAYPNDPRSLYGRAATLTKLGRDADAAAAQKDFAAAWGDADTTLSPQNL